MVSLVFLRSPREPSMRIALLSSVRTSGPRLRTAETSLEANEMSLHGSVAGSSLRSSLRILLNMLNSATDAVVRPTASILRMFSRMISPKMVDDASFLNFLAQYWSRSTPSRDPISSRISFIVSSSSTVSAMRV